MGKKMLPLLSIGLLSVTLVACGSTAVPPAKTDTATTTPATTTAAVAPAADQLPFDYPAVKLDVKAGDTVLAPSRSMIDSDFEAQKNGSSGTYIFYNATVVEAGATAAKLKQIIDEVTIPNALIVPIKAGQTAKTGDIVLTWWQSGSGLQRAYVTEGGKTPKVVYLDGKNIGTDTLKADSFNVLSSDWQQGTTVACKDRESGKYEQFTLINSVSDMNLISGWAGSLKTIAKSQCVAAPIKGTYKAGDTVYVAPFGTFQKATVSSVDTANGKIKAKYDFAGSSTEEEFSFGSILTTLPL